MISRAQWYVIAPKAPEKTGAVQKLRHFDGYANLAPASWSAAVPSGALHPRDAMISRAQGYVIAPKAPEKTGAVQKLRYFEGYANFAPASWSAVLRSSTAEGGRLSLLPLFHPRGAEAERVRNKLSS